MGQRASAKKPSPAFSCLSSRDSQRRLAANTERSYCFLQIVIGDLAEFGRGYILLMELDLLTSGWVSVGAQSISQSINQSISQCAPTHPNMESLKMVLKNLILQEFAN